MRSVLPLVLLLLVGGLGLPGVPGLAPAQVTAQEGDRPGTFRRYLFAGVGAVAFGSLAYIAAPDREGVLCAGKTCTAATAAVVGGTIGFLLGKDFDERATRRALGGPRLAAVPRSVLVGDVPHALAELPGGIVALEDGGATLLDRSLQATSLFRGARGRAAVGWPGGGHVLIAADSLLVAVPFPTPGSLPLSTVDTLEHLGGTAAAATPGGGLLLGSRTSLRRLDLPAAPGSGSTREAERVDLPGLAQSLSAEAGVVWVLTDTILEARDPESLELLSRLVLAGPGRDLSVSQNRGAVALGTEGLLILDLTARDRPIVLAHVDPAAVVFAVDFSDQRLYAAVGGDGLQVYDVVRPDAPRLIGTQGDLGLAVDVLAREDWVLVLDRLGRRVLRFEAADLEPRP